jgi:PTH1 family peptidyl-tRNA hydrolase
MWLIVGLGNPGASYQQHRHNVGFMLVDAIAKYHHAGGFKSKFSSYHADVMIGDQKVMLCKPQTFMNLSGQAVGEISRFYNIDPTHILVLHDELDLLPAKVRIKQGGGHGGHNGLRDIDRHIGKDYWRLRFGIGHPGHKDRVHSYVLEPFTIAEQADIQDTVDVVAKHIGLMWSQNHEALMTKIALASAPLATTTKPVKATEQ